MIQGGDGAGLAVEAFQGGLILGLGRRQHLDGHAAAHEFVFAEIDAAHAAGAEALQHLVAADGEAAPLAEHDLLGLEVRQQAIADQQAGQLAGGGRQRGRGAQTVQVRREFLLIDDLAFAHQVEEFVYGRWRRHRRTFG